MITKNDMFKLFRQEVDIMNNLGQHDIILWAMLNNPQKEWWSAKDFQYGEYFVGYEATARMSELVLKYPTLVKRDMDGRFRIIGIFWESQDEVKQQRERLEFLINSQEQYIIQLDRGKEII